MKLLDVLLGRRTPDAELRERERKAREVAVVQELSDATLSRANQLLEAYRKADGVLGRE